MQVAIYARSAQNCSHVQEQVTICTKFAQSRGWEVSPHYTFVDNCVSGNVADGCHSLTSLLELAKQSTKPFDIVLVEDTSRLGRNIVGLLRIIEALHHLGIYVQFVSQGLTRERELPPVLVHETHSPSQILGIVR